MKEKKLVAYLFLILVLLNAFNPLVKVEAAINTSYSKVEVDEPVDELPFGPTLAQWIGEILFTLAHGIENIGASLMKLFTGSYVFPYSDKIIFNTIPILDVNFINPANGSFFKDSDGNWTDLGKIIRNIYFTILAISLSFLTLLIGVIAIRLAISTIASEKAKYKEAIINFLTCIILLFGLHFLLSFTFYVNEKLVEVASSAMKSMLSTGGDEFVQSLQALADENNEAIAENFTKVATEKCFLSKIPIIGQLYQGLLDTIHAIGNVVNKIWNFFTGKSDEEDEISQEQLGDMYPNKETYANELLKGGPKNGEVRKNVMAYLLKQEYYRSTYLKWIKGNDTNSLNKGGLGGVCRNILITLNDVFGVADTGYKALRTLYTSVIFITFVPKDDNDIPYKSTLDEAIEKNGGDPTKTQDSDEGLSADKVKHFELEKGQYLSSQIKSTEDYLAYKDAVEADLTKVDNSDEECEDKIKELEAKKKKGGLSSDEEKKINDQISAAEDEIEMNKEHRLACYLNSIYADAYYLYVYEGDDKIQPTTDEFVSELGNYFKQTSWYVDTENDDWSPTTINFVSVACYAVFIFQSLLFFFAYAKRFFYVVILSMLGPVVVVYDYMAKSV